MMKMTKSFEMKRNYLNVVVQSGQYEQNHTIVKVSYTTRSGLIRRLEQLSRQHAVYGDNWAGWINADIAIASDDDKTGPCNIIGGEWCEPANGWLDFNEYRQLHCQLNNLGIIK